MHIKAAYIFALEEAAGNESSDFNCLSRFFFCPVSQIKFVISLTVTKQCDKRRDVR